MNSRPILAVEQLEKHFRVGAGLVKAVDGIDLAIRRGRTLALVGESGCGKTTTARMVLRLEHPTSGRVVFDGSDIAQLKGEALASYRMRVQAVFQDPWASLNPRMRVRDVIAEALLVNRRIGRREVDSAVDEVLTEVGLRPEYRLNYPHEFSGGQRQRVAIAAALISKPDLIVLDEPVSALDVSIRSQIMNLFKDIQKLRGVTYLLVAHDLGTTRYMADETAVMYLGKIVEYGETETLFASNFHPYTGALFSAALPSHPDAVTKEIVLHGEVPSPLNPPGGCPFHTRCPAKIGARCEREAPALRRVPGSSAGHLVACHLLDEKVG